MSSVWDIFKHKRWIPGFLTPYHKLLTPRGIDSLIKVDLHVQPIRIILELTDVFVFSS
jgi:hypothetical protein